MFDIEEKKELFEEIAKSAYNASEDDLENNKFVSEELQNKLDYYNIYDLKASVDIFSLRIEENYLADLEDTLYEICKNKIYNKLIKNEEVFYIIEKDSFGDNDIRATLSVKRFDEKNTFLKTHADLSEDDLNILEKYGLKFIKERGVKEYICIFNDEGLTNISILSCYLIYDIEEKDFDERYNNFLDKMKKIIKQSIVSAWNKNIELVDNIEEGSLSFSNFNEDTLPSFIDTECYKFREKGIGKIVMYPNKTMYKVKCTVEKDLVNYDIIVNIMIYKVKLLRSELGKSCKLDYSEVRILRYHNNKKILMYYDNQSPNQYGTVAHYGIIASHILNFIEENFFRAFIMEFIKNVPVNL